MNTKSMHVSEHAASPIAMVSRTPAPAMAAAS